MQSQDEYDWQGIEREYRLGTRSIADIGAEYGVTEETIQMCANFDNWTRDQPKKIRDKTSERAGSCSADKVEAEDPKITDRRTGEKNDQEKKKRDQAHREKLAHGIKLIMQILHKLKDPFSASRLDKKLLGFNGDVDPQSIAMLQKAVSLPGRAKYARKLTAALSRLIKLQREAYGLNGGECYAEKPKLRITVIHAPPSKEEKSDDP